MSPVVAIDLSCLEVQPETGVERYARLLLEHLGPVAGSLLPIGLLRPGSAAPNVEPPVRLEILPSFLPRLAWRETALASAVQRLQARVLHAPVTAVPLRTKAKIAVTVHDVPAPEGPGALPRLSRHRLRLAHALSRADRIIVPSQATRDALLLRAPGIAQKIRVVHHGVDRDFTPLGLPFDLQRFGLRRGRYLLHVGTVRERKDPKTLVEAFARLARDPGFDDLQLLFAGVLRADWDELMRPLAGTPAASRVHHLGYVSREDLPRLFRSAEAVVLPSRLEGFGLPAVEAMASGVPLVTSDDQALREVAGDAAFVFQAGDAPALAELCAGLLLSPERRDAARSRGLARARAFDWSRTARAHAEIYRELIEESLRGADAVRRA